MDTKSDLISRSHLTKRLTMMGANGAKSHVRAYARCVNEVETAPNAQMWIGAERGLPAESEAAVLVVVSGRYGGIEFRDAVQLGWYSADEGWIIENYEKWTEPQVKWWMPVPEMPEEDS